MGVSDMSNDPGNSRDDERGYTKADITHRLAHAPIPARCTSASEGAAVIADLPRALPLAVDLALRHLRSSPRGFLSAFRLLPTFKNSEPTRMPHRDEAPKEAIRLLRPSFERGVDGYLPNYTKPDVRRSFVYAPKLRLFHVRTAAMANPQRSSPCFRRRPGRL